MRRSGRACALALAVAAMPLLAHDGAHVSGAPGAPTAGRAWDFTLATLDGSRFVQASAINGPVLVNFWGKDCGPCITEMPRLAAFAKTHPQWTVLLVATDAPSDASSFVQRHGVQLPVLRSGANVAALMRTAGNRNGGLPFSVALRDGRVCVTQSGELHESDLQRLLHAVANCPNPP